MHSSLCHFQDFLKYYSKAGRDVEKLQVWTKFQPPKVFSIFYSIPVLILLYHVISQKAVEVMCFVPKRCNDMMNVGRLQGFEVNLHFKYLMRFEKWDVMNWLCVCAVPGEDYSSGEAAPTGYFLRQRAGRQHSIQSEGETSLSVWAAGYLQWADREEKGLSFARVYLQKQHQGEERGLPLHEIIEILFSFCLILPISAL